MTRARGRLRASVAVGTIVATSLVTGFGDAGAADGPNSGVPWIVTVGDSAISGEAGRWAGNTNGPSGNVDALGAHAYADNATGTAEQISGCHRSKAAEAHIGGGVMSLNLACSGARTYTQAGSGDFKPGVDFYADASGRKGQALMLHEFAATHNVEAVTVLIGANNFGFADIVQTCVTNWLTSPSWWKNYCHDDGSIAAGFTPTAVAARTAEVRDAILRVARRRWRPPATPTADYRIIVQTYSSPIPRGAQIRYPESGWSRQAVGGCGVWNRDADWANDSAVVKMNEALTNGATQTGLDQHRRARTTAT